MGQGNGRGGPAAERPLSPHLQIYRPQINMVMSIVHRITGAGLYFGMLLLAWWLLAAATGPGPYADVSWFFGTLIGKLILFGFTWALMHHALGGVRHLIWDTGRGFELSAVNALSWGTLVGSVALTLAVWIAVAAMRGGL